MFIYIPQEYEYLVWEKRSRDNTYVKIAGLDYIKNFMNRFGIRHNRYEQILTGITPQEKTDGWLEVLKRY
jgi:hypothetical protein